jgi:hypothetical protein
VTDRLSRGSAPLEFVGVSALIAAVALAVIQFAVVAHVKAIVIDSAMAGAAFGSLADWKIVLFSSQVPVTPIDSMPMSLTPRLASSNV